MATKQFYTPKKLLYPQDTFLAMPEENFSRRSQNITLTPNDGIDTQRKEQVS